MMGALGRALRRFLGGASIEGPEGPLSGRVVQPRQLALLALLASARGQPISRDKLVAVLWHGSSMTGG
jgi:DNA-binding SARP family transcriptional activator